MTKKVLIAGASIMVVTQFVAMACYVATTRTCPSRANRGSSTCNLYSGSTYPWVTLDDYNSGRVSAKSDGMSHCQYFCPSTGAYFWSYPGSITDAASSPCNNGG